MNNMIMAEEADWSKYKPRTAPDYLTLWEIALQMVDLYRLDYPLDKTDSEALAHGYALPALARWIFTDNGKHGAIDFSKTEWQIFVSRFFMEFFNNEIAYMNPSVWRMKLMSDIARFQFVLENAAQPLYKAVLTASLTVTHTHESSTENSDSVTEKRTSEVTGTHTDIGERSSSRTGADTSTSSENTTSRQQATSTMSGEESGTDKTSGTDSGTDSSRVLQSDTPQSIVNQATVGSPELTTWKYASGLQDTNGKKNSTSSRDTTTTGQRSSNSEDTGTAEENRTGESSTKRTEQLTDNSSQTNTDERSETGSNEQTRKGTGKTTGNDVSATVSEYTATRERYDFFMEHLQEPVQTIVNNFYPLFRSVYVDEFRMGFLDWGEPEAMAANIYKEVSE